VAASILVMHLVWFGRTCSRRWRRTTAALWLNRQERGWDRGPCCVRPRVKQVMAAEAVGVSTYMIWRLNH